MEGLLCTGPWPQTLMDVSKDNPHPTFTMTRPAPLHDSTYRLPNWLMTALITEFSSKAMCCPIREKLASQELNIFPFLTCNMEK